MRRFTWLLPLLILSALFGSAALAFDSWVGTEIVLTDAEGEHLLGYGLVADQGLVLEVVQRADRFMMLVVGPDGSFEMLSGEIDAAGRVLLTGEDGVPFALADRLAEAGIAFELRRVVGGEDGIDESDDHEDDDRNGPGGGGDHDPDDGDEPDDDEPDDDDPDDDEPDEPDDDEPDEPDDDEPDDDEPDDDEPDEPDDDDSSDDNGGSGNAEDEDRGDDEDEEPEDRSGSGGSGGDDPDDDDDS
jgi:hypothetical protein